MIRHLFVLILSAIIIIGKSTDTEILFPETQTDSIIEEHYSPLQVRGKKIYSAYVFPNRAYYVYIGVDVSTRINLPYPIKEPPSNPAPDLIRIDYHPGDHYLYIKPIQSDIEGIKTNIHIECDRRFSVLVNVIVDHASVANQLVNFLDGSEHQELKNNSKQYFQQKAKQLDAQLEKRNALLISTLSSDTITIPIDKRKRFQSTETRLISISRTTDYLIAQFAIKGDSNLIHSSDIRLEYRSITPSFLSETKGDSIIVIPDDTINTRSLDEAYITAFFPFTDPLSIAEIHLSINNQVFQETISFRDHTPNRSRRSHI